jgi:hypothetical protein
MNGEVSNAFVQAWFKALDDAAADSPPAASEMYAGYLEGLNDPKDERHEESLALQKAMGDSMDAALKMSGYCPECSALIPLRFQENDCPECGKYVYWEIDEEPVCP